MLFVCGVSYILIVVIDRWIGVSMIDGGWNGWIYVNLYI